MGCHCLEIKRTVNLFAPQCPSKTFGGFDTTKEFPDEVVTFARSHPAMFNPIYPINNRPIIVKTDVDYQFTHIVVDKVEAEDGQYDVMFIGTGSHLNTYLHTYYYIISNLEHNASERVHTKLIHVILLCTRHGDNTKSGMHPQRLLARPGRSPFGRNDCLQSKIFS